RNTRNLTKQHEPMLILKVHSGPLRTNRPLFVQALAYQRQFSSSLSCQSCKSCQRSLLGICDMSGFHSLTSDLSCVSWCRSLTDFCKVGCNRRGASSTSGTSTKR